MTDVARYWDGVPSVDDEPAKRAGLGTLVPSRRTMMKSIVALGGALALNVVSALPPGRPKSASAAVGTEHLNCAGYNNYSGYNNNTKACVGFTYSRSYCGSDGWFIRSSGTCYNSYPISICGEGSYSNRNAWRWTHSGTPYRCADGKVATCGGTSTYICSWSNP
ncbi:hypothetical protein OHA25_21000 [Nonomuraea sp. NBC_00507]|uniref:hypothetical protein n=1 Tax=Nonomuraea sp. NBC_00507 TaxID=2976002 RepID=UPI002E19D45C